MVFDFSFVHLDTTDGPSDGDAAVTLYDVYLSL